LSFSHIGSLTMYIRMTLELEILTRDFLAVDMDPELNADEA